MTERVFTFGDWVGNGINVVVHPFRNVRGIFMLLFVVIGAAVGIILVSGEGRPDMTEVLRDSICAELGVVLPYVGQVGTMVLTGDKVQVTTSRFFREPDWYYYDKSTNIRNTFCHHIIRARVFDDGEYTLLGVDVSEIKFP